MTRFRKWILTLAVALALLVPFAGAASADPGDGGGFSGSSAIVGTRGRPAITTTAADPGDGGGY